MKFFVLFTLLFSVCTLSACDVERMTTLPELSRPYMGVYECEILRLGERELSADFEYLRIELYADGNFRLHYRTKGGEEGGFEGEFEADPTRKEITFRLPKEEKSRTYPMREGAIFIDEMFLGKPLHAEFRMP